MTATYSEEELKELEDDIEFCRRIEDRTHDVATQFAWATLGRDHLPRLLETVRYYKTMIDNHMDNSTPIQRVVEESDEMLMLDSATCTED